MPSTTDWSLRLGTLHEAAGFLLSDGTLCELNDGAVRLLELDDAARNTLSTGPFRALFDELSGSLAEEILRITGEEGHWHGEVFFQTGAGSPLPVYLIVSSLREAAAAEDRPAFVFLALNYAEQHYALGDRVKRQAILQKLLKAAPMGILAADREGRLVEVNEEAQTLWATAAQELSIGQTLAEAFASLSPTLREVIKAGQAGEAARLNREPFGGDSGRLVSLECIPYGKRASEPDNILIFIEDRTAELKLEDQLRETERFASLGFMAANIAHEINNPLHAVRGALERIALLREDLLQQLRAGADVTAMGHVIEEMERTERRGIEVIDRIGGIVSPVLEQARPHQAQTAKENINALLARIVEGMSHHKLLRQIDVTISVAETVPAVETDGGMVSQILTNLIINAAHAMKGTGAIALTASLGEAGTIEVLIQDSGPGIEARDVPFLFTPFFTTKPVGEGTGLGLYASRAMAQKLGGWLEFAPEHGPGACFILRLPLEYTGPSHEVDLPSPLLRVSR